MARRVMKTACVVCGKVLLQPGIRGRFTFGPSEDEVSVEMFAFACDDHADSATIRAAVAQTVANSTPCPAA